MTWLETVCAKRQAAALAYMNAHDPHDWDATDRDAAIDLAHAKGVMAALDATGQMTDDSCELEERRNVVARHFYTEADLA